jgi:hypothetical protein
MPLYLIYTSRHMPNIFRAVKITHTYPIDKAELTIGEMKLNMAAIVILKKVQHAVTDAPFPGTESTK